MDILDKLAGRKPENGRKKLSRSVKQQVAKKQDWKCFSCKKSMNTYDFDVHHKDGNPANNNITNLRALHTSCHRRIERSKVKKKNRSAPKSDLDYLTGNRAGKSDLDYLTKKGSRKSVKSDLDYLLGSPKKTKGKRQPDNMYEYFFGK